MSRTKKFLYNSATTAFYQIILMFAGLITPRIMLKYYGSEINGLVSSINQFIVYFNLVEAGLSGAAIYALYKPLAENDHKAINGVVSAAKKFYTQSGYIFLSFTVGLATIYPFYIKTSLLSKYDVCVLVLILGVNGALEFFTLAKYRALLTADQRTYVISLASIIHIIINTLVIVILGTMQVDIVILRSVALLSIFFRSFILMIYVHIRYKFINFKEKPNIDSMKKRWDALYLQTLGAAQVGAPIISVYVIFNMVMSSINGILSIFKSGLAASFGDVIAKGETKILQKAYGEFEFSFYALISVVYITALLTIMPFVRTYTSGVTDTQYDLPVVGFLFVLNGLLYNIKTPQGMLVIAAGLFKETRVQTTIQAGIAIVLGIILTSFYGIYGVLIASILSNAYRVIDLLYFIPRHLTKLPVRITAYRILSIGISIFISWIPFHFIKFNPDTYIKWGIYALLTSVYVLIIVIIQSYITDKQSMRGALNRFTKKRKAI